jgi:hypothetical protein
MPWHGFPVILSACIPDFAKGAKEFISLEDVRGSCSESFIVEDRVENSREEEMQKDKCQRRNWDAHRGAVLLKSSPCQKMFAFRSHLPRACFPSQGVLIQSPAVAEKMADALARLG